MKSLRMLGAGRVELVELPEPSAGVGEVVVETAMSALCGSELKGYRGDGQPSGNSGHEAAGVVVAVGEGVDPALLGQRVGVCAVAGCGQCEQCAAGRTTWCGSFRVYVNMHAERFVAAASALHRLPDDLPWEPGVLLTGDGLGVPYHTSQRLPTRGGDTVVVIGCGPIGLGNILLHAFRGARVVAFDIVDERLAMAQDVGAAETIRADQVDPVEAVKELTRGLLAEAVIEATGRPEGFALALKLVGKGGRVACCGENRDVTLNVGSDLIRRDITVFGSWFFHFREFPEMLDLVRRGLAVHKLVTHRYPLDRIGDAFADFVAGRVGKPAIVP